MIEIYKITNKRNGKIYIGQTSRTVRRRFKTHLRAICDMVICRAVKKYGHNNFKCKILTSTESHVNADKLEMLYIRKYRKRLGRYNVYNSTDGGGGVRGCHWRLSDKAKRNISEALRGRVFTKDWREKLSEAASKRRLTFETRKKISKGVNKMWEKLNGEGWKEARHQLERVR